MDIKADSVSPNFGMAFRKPTGKALKSLTEAVEGSKVKQRGLKQFIKEQKNLKYYDVDYVAYKDGRIVSRIINNNKGSVERAYEYIPGYTGLDAYGEQSYPGRKLIAKIFNPKKLLPRSLYFAGEEAKKLEQKKLMEETITKNINKWF